MKTSAITKSEVSNPSVSKTASAIDSVIITVVGLSACAIGLWALACIIGGVVAGGGIGGFVMGWFKAVSGL